MPYYDRDRIRDHNFDDHPHGGRGARAPTGPRPGVDERRAHSAWLCLGWVAVKELKLSYYIGETLVFTVYTHYGNLI